MKEIQSNFESKIFTHSKSIITSNGTDIFDHWTFNLINTFFSGYFSELSNFPHWIKFIYTKWLCLKLLSCLQHSLESTSTQFWEQDEQYFFFVTCFHPLILWIINYIYEFFELLCSMNIKWLSKFYIEINFTDFSHGPLQRNFCITYFEYQRMEVIPCTRS